MICEEGRNKQDYLSYRKSVVTLRTGVPRVDAGITGGCCTDISYAPVESIYDNGSLLVDWFWYFRMKRILKTQKKYQLYVIPRVLSSLGNQAVCPEMDVNENDVRPLKTFGGN